ncbi:hypothetical protein [Phytoactinopolyspora halophila]|uniref:hypothetical protein n=1 Tax=Phytoactinopolyspora halophila TaxID=1981511 RepID=UPI000F4D6823|nr:hypothetical protein [Phytoactinopolyspora halophila]
MSGGICRATSASPVHDLEARGKDGACLVARRQHIMLYDCPECGLPATVTHRARLSSTSGQIEHVDVRCAADHRFLGPADRLRVLLPR